MGGHDVAAEAPVTLQDGPLHQGLLPHQIPSWEAAEAAVGIKEARQTHQTTPPSPSASVPFGFGDCRNPPPFVGHKAFGGSKLGYVFKLGASGLGYYQDGPMHVATSIRTPLCLDSLVPPTPNAWTDPCWLDPTTWCAQPPSPKRPCRRRLLPNGRRLFPRAKAGPASASLVANPDDSGTSMDAHGIDPLGTIVNDKRWWVPKGLWAIETSNANSWESLKHAMLSRSMADVIIAQETKLLSEASLLSAQRQARKLGWNPTLSRAHRTAQYHGSGGNAILARKGIGIAPIADTVIRADLRHRLQASWVGGVCKGGIYIISIYLKDAEGLSETNMYILEQAAIYIKALKGPWIIGGDWNLEPHLLTAANWLNMVGGVVHAPSQPTCHAHVYDYFVVHKAISPAIAGVQRLEDAGLFPHFPARLLIKGNALRYQVRKLLKPPKVPGYLPAGPPAPPPSYDNVHRPSAH